MKTTIVRAAGIACLLLLFFLSTFGWRFRKTEDLLILEKEKNMAYRLKEHVYKLSQQIGDRSMFNYQNLIEAQNYIEDEFKSLGYAVEFNEYFVQEKAARNIIAFKKGKEKPDEIIIVGAHYDTCFNPGADDNASGVAGLIELARIFSQQETKRTIKFIAFVNEEPPFFKTDKMGSRAYAQKAKEKDKNIKGVIVFEMIGYYSDKVHSQRYPPFLGPFYPNRGDFIIVVGNFSSRRLAKQVVKSFKKNSSFPMESLTAFNIVPGVDFSDHSSFWHYRYPAVMVTDTAFYRNPNYHAASDTYETLDYNRMAAVIAGFEKVILSLSN